MPPQEKGKGSEMTKDQREELELLATGTVRTIESIPSAVEAILAEYRKMIDMLEKVDQFFRDSNMDGHLAKDIESLLDHLYENR